MNCTRLLGFMALLALLSPPAAHAQLTLNFASATQSGAPGDTLTFSGKVENIGASRIYLNDVEYPSLGAGLTISDSPFFLNAPAFLDGGQSQTFSMFDVAIDPGATFGDYNGSFTIKGGSGIDSLTPQVTTNFTVRVVPVPGALVTTALGAMLPAFSFALRRRRSQTQKSAACQA